MLSPRNPEVLDFQKLKSVDKILITKEHKISPNSKVLDLAESVCKSNSFITIYSSFLKFKKTLDADELCFAFSILLFAKKIDMGLIDSQLLPSYSTMSRGESLQFILDYNLDKPPFDEDMEKWYAKKTLEAYLKFLNEIVTEDEQGKQLLKSKYQLFCSWRNKQDITIKSEYNENYKEAIALLLKKIKPPVFDQNVLKLLRDTEQSEKLTNILNSLEAIKLDNPQALTQYIKVRQIWASFKSTANDRKNPTYKFIKAIIKDYDLQLEIEPLTDLNLQNNYNRHSLTQNGNLAF